MLRIARPLFDQMLDHLRAVHPEEGCGFLAAKNGLVTAVYPIENRLHSPEAYEMAPGPQIKTMIAIEEAGLELAAIFHSHPHSPPFPSATDISRAFYPESLMLIVSLAELHQPNWGLYAVEDGRVAANILRILPA